MSRLQVEMMIDAISRRYSRQSDAMKSAGETGSSTTPDGFQNIPIERLARGGLAAGDMGVIVNRGAPRG